MTRRPQTNARMGEKDFICFYHVIKEAAKEHGPIRFVIQDENDAHHIEIRKEGGLINQAPMSDHRMRRYLTYQGIAAHFERLFIEATKKYYPEALMAVHLSLAKLADLAAKYKQVMDIELPIGQERVTFSIWREDNQASFSLNGNRLTTEEALDFIRKHHGLFLVNMKYGIKTVKKRASGQRNYTFQKRGGQTGEGQAALRPDGSLLVDPEHLYHPKARLCSRQKPKDPAIAAQRIAEMNKKILRPAGQSGPGYVEED